MAGTSSGVIEHAACTTVVVTTASTVEADACTAAEAYQAEAAQTGVDILGYGDTLGYGGDEVGYA